jgi:activating signal cointegrator complex subunit 2
MLSTTLPSFAPFPEAPWRDNIVPVEWEACLSAWLALTEAYLSLPEHDLIRHIKHDDSIASFQASFVKETAASGTNILGSSHSAAHLLRQCFLLCSRLLRLPSPPSGLLTWEFLADFSRVYGKKNAGPPVKAACHKLDTEASLQALKKSLILSLDSGIKGDLTILERRLKRLNHLVHASPDVAAFLLAGSDFLDGLVSCFKVMNPPLRKAIVTTTYLCLIGLTEGDSPKYSTLADQLYSLKTAADTHKAGISNANDSMVVELVTVTPILKQIQHRLEHSDTGFTRSKPVITALEAYRKPGASVRPKRLVKRKIDKGKGIMTQVELELPGEMRVHRMSQVSQIQDLFPELGSWFISQLLDEYDDNTEEVIAHLLEDSLPPHLAGADRTRELLVLPNLCSIAFAANQTTVRLSERGGRAATLPLAQPPLRFPYAITSLMTMSWTGWRLMCQISTLANGTRDEQQMISLTTDQLPPTRLLFSPHFQLSMPTTMSGMIHTMLPMPDSS